MAKGKKKHNAENIKISPSKDVMGFFQADTELEKYKITEAEKYNRKITDIDDKVLEFSKKAYDFSLDLDQLKLLKRQLIQAANIYEHIIGMDKGFVTNPELHQSLIQKGKNAAEKLKGLTGVVESSIEGKEAKLLKNENKEDDPEFVISAKNESNRLALFEQLGIVDFLINKHETALKGRPGNTTLLLAMLMGIDQKSITTFKANVKNLLNKSDKSPDNTTSRNRNAGELAKIGIDLPKK